MDEREFTGYEVGTADWGKIALTVVNYNFHVGISLKDWEWVSLLLSVLLSSPVGMCVLFKASLFVTLFFPTLLRSN